MTDHDTNPADLALDDLRALRADLQHQDDVVSYVRRLAQARFDLVGAELRHRANADNSPEGLPAILGSHLTGGPARPPRPADDFSDHPLATDFEALCIEHGGADYETLTDVELRAYADAIHEFEQALSKERHLLFARIDALTAELVRRYRDGEASVDGLLASD